MSEPSQTPAPSLLARSVENFISVLGVWHSSLRHRAIYAGLGDLLVPVVVLLLVQTIGYRVLQPFAGFNIQVLQSFAGGTALALFSFIVCLALLRKSDKAWELVVGLLWALVIGTFLSIAALKLGAVTSPADWMVRKFGVVFLVPLLFLLARLGSWSGGSAFVALIIPTLLIALPWYSSLGRNTPDEEAYFFDPDIEKIYAAQPELLNAQISNLRPGMPGKVELFAVLGAGYPFEGVFRREVEAVSELLAEQFGAVDRVLSLVNSERDQDTYPLMNRVNLTAALKATAAAMNPEDVALLFLTSHGGPGVLSTSFYEVVTRDVTPNDVSSALDDAGISNAVIIISACYSGSFIDALAAPDRLILTAADADNVSFGCNDKNEWTDWGRAFFVDALAQTRDLRQAAVIARDAVAKREVVEKLPPSSPQISEGADIGRVLDALLAEQE